MLALVFAWCAWPAVAFGASEIDPHAGLTSSPFGCVACHDSSGIIFVSAGDTGSGIKPASDAACVRCHVLPEGKGPKVYAGDEAHYRVADGFGHNDPTQVSCLNCHSIHGPHFESPALAGKLLRPLKCQPEALAAVHLATAPHDRALSVWCTGCHKEWPKKMPASVRGRISQAAWMDATSIHPFAPKGGTSWRECESCLSCHAAGGGFPHYTPGADAGLVGAASASDKRTVVADRRTDGVCLGCHRNGAAGAYEGIGVTF